MKGREWKRSGEEKVRINKRGEERRGREFELCTVGKKKSYKSIGLNVIE